MAAGSEALGRMIMEIIKRLHPGMQRLVSNSPRDPAVDVEDFEQEAAYRLLQQGKLEKMTGPQRLGTLWRTFRNLVADSSRKHAANKDVTLVSANSDEEWQQLAGIYGESFNPEKIDQLRLCRDAVKSLPPTVQTMFRMRFCDGYRDWEIAQLLGTTRSNVKALRSIYLKKLRKELKRKSRRGRRKQP
jgi:RNA polymerase sigma factor (sigma-70 family)